MRVRTTPSVTLSEWELDMTGIKRDDRVSLLQDVWLFERCTKRQLRDIAGIATPLLADAGRVFARQGEVGNDFSIIVEGEAAATIDGEEIARLGPGSFFGEMALLDGGPRTATVVARTPMLLLVLNRREFDALLEQGIPSVARRILSVLAERLRRADERVVGAGPRLSGL